MYCNVCHSQKFPLYFFIKGEHVSLLACKCNETERQRLDAEQQREHHKQHISELRNNCIGDESYRAINFDTDDGKGDRNAKTLAKQYVDNWEALSKKNIGLLFSGAPGGGKTFLACCIANALIDMDVEAWITTIPALISDMSANFGSDKPDIIHRIQSVDLLILDDLGVERKGYYTAEKLFEIIDARYRSKRPLIVTTNLSTAEIRQPNELEYQRIFDRITEMCQPIQVQGASRREDKAREKAEYIQQLFTQSHTQTGESSSSER